MSFKGVVNSIFLLFWITIPLTLWLLPANFFDHGDSICLSQVLLDKECPGCGITRGIQHALHFEFKQAWEFNKLSFIVLPILFFLWVKTIFRFWRRVFKVKSQ